MRTRDGLPESTSYQDEGCDLHHECLSCPLPACRYEMPPGRARALSQAAALGRLLDCGHTMEEAAMELGVSRRTVYRLRRISPPAPHGQPVPLRTVVRPAGSPSVPVVSGHPYRAIAG